MTRLLLTLLLICLCCLTACGGAGEPTPGPAGEAAAGAAEEERATLRVGMVSHGEVVNIRQQPTTESRILDTARRGDLFQVQESGIAGGDGNTWALINYRGANAYISESYLYISEWQDQQPLTIAVIANTEAKVYIRGSARADGEVLYSAFRGEQMIVTDQETSPGWYQIFYPDGAAYVEAQYAELTETTINDALFE